MLARILGATMAAATITGCASTNAEPGFRDVATIVHQRTGQSLRWNRGTSEDRKCGGGSSQSAA